MDETREEFRRKVMDRIQKTRMENGDIPIPFLGGRPEREVGQEGRIKKNDVINLKIALNTCKSLEEFLSKV